MLVLSPESEFASGPCDGAYIANEFIKGVVVSLRGSRNALRAECFIPRAGRLVR
ncbi:hypothetical protein B0G73_101226 [Paraburkholderia sp. BL25I1N1]|nr:hypothetical protein B0G73_101226 [Paraburkholderia sp. BL25I1N1]